MVYKKIKNTVINILVKMVDLFATTSSFFFDLDTLFDCIKMIFNTLVPVSRYVDRYVIICKTLEERYRVFQGFS